MNRKRTAFSHMAQVERRSFIIGRQKGIHQDSRVQCSIPKPHTLPLQCYGILTQTLNPSLS